tara:strand:- start:1000 stop:1152 length:153 start_codon:yes stop_codon:yes gene_type:complete
MIQLNKLKSDLLKNKYSKYILLGSFTFFFLKGLVWLGIFLFVGLGMFNNF